MTINKNVSPESWDIKNIWPKCLHAIEQSFTIVVIKFTCVQKYTFEWTRGVARKDPRRGFWGQKLPKDGILRVRKLCGYAPERRFVRVLVEMTKKFGPMGGEGFWPLYPPPLATPLISRVMLPIDSVSLLSFSGIFPFCSFWDWSTAYHWTSG